MCELCLWLTWIMGCFESNPSVCMSLILPANTHSIYFPIFFGNSFTLAEGKLPIGFKGQKWRENENVRADRERERELLLREAFRSLSQPHRSRWDDHSLSQAYLLLSGSATQVSDGIVWRGITGGWGCLWFSPSRAGLDWRWGSVPHQCPFPPVWLSGLFLEWFMAWELRRWKHVRSRYRQTQRPAEEEEEEGLVSPSRACASCHGAGQLLLGRRAPQECWRGSFSLHFHPIFSPMSSEQFMSGCAILFPEKNPVNWEGEKSLAPPHFTYTHPQWLRAKFSDTGGRVAPLSIPVALWASRTAHAPGQVSQMGWKGLLWLLLS